MSERGRPKAVLVLTDEERQTLARWARRPNSPQSLALRSRIVLGCADGKTNQAVAAELGCHHVTVGKWRSRFVARRLNGLSDEYRSGVPRTVTDDHVEAVVVKTLTEKPVDATRWSTRGFGQGDGDEPADDQSDLEGVRAQTVAGGHVSSRRPIRCSSTRSATLSRCT